MATLFASTALVLAALLCLRLSRSASAREHLLGLVSSRGEGSTDGATLPGRSTLRRFVPWLAVAGGAGVGAAVGWYLAGPVGIVVGGSAAPLVMASRRGRRRNRHTEALEGQLAEAAEMMAFSLRSGLSIMQALEAASKEAEEPMGSILRRLARERALGSPLESALDSFAAEIGSEDARMLALVIGLHGRSGGDLGNALDEVARAVRHRMAVRREVRALSAQGRISSLVLAALPAAFFLFLATSSRTELTPVYRSPPGMAMLGSGLVLQGLGYLWIRRLLRVRI